jgi:hypothetical protein
MLLGGGQRPRPASRGGRPSSRSPRAAGRSRTANPGARALRPSLRQSMQLSERAGDTTPVGLRLGRSALHVGHHDHTVGEVSAVHGWDRHRYRHPLTVEGRNSLVSHPRSMSPRPPRRPTASCPLTLTLHTSLTPAPPVSRSMRATSSPIDLVPPIHGDSFVSFSRGSTLAPKTPRALWGNAPCGCVSGIPATGQPLVELR